MAPSSLLAHLLLLTLGCAALTHQARAEGGSSFNYQKAGTDFGGLCATGIRQSPIHVVDAHAKLKIKQFNLNYQTNFVATITSKNISFEITPDPSKPCKLEFQGDEYQLLQLHAHAVSEHSYNGHLSPLEVHFVHRSVANPSQLLVLGVFFSFHPKDEPNAFLETFLSRVPSTRGATAQVFGELNYMEIISPNSLRRLILGTLLPLTKVYTYPGSLTTPGCSEIVTWLVVEPCVGPTLSVDQWKRFQIITSTLSGGVPVNNRPPQPLGTRELEVFKTYL